MDNVNMSITSKTYGVRVNQRFSRMIESFLENGTFQSPSELLRSALREKIQRDAPDLYSTFKEVEN